MIFRNSFFFCLLFISCRLSYILMSFPSPIILSMQLSHPSAIPFQYVSPAFVPTFSDNDFNGHLCIRSSNESALKFALASCITHSSEPLRRGHCAHDSGVSMTNTDLPLFSPFSCLFSYSFNFSSHLMTFFIIG